MRSVYKYRATFGGAIGDMVPASGEVVLAGNDNRGHACVWLDVDSELPRSKQFNDRFVIVGTGHEIAALSIHRYSWFDGPYVWHLYEVLS